MAMGRTLVTTWAAARGGRLEGGHWLPVVKLGRPALGMDQLLTPLIRTGTAGGAGALPP